MNQITIICGDPMVEKLLRYMTAELSETVGPVILLNVAQMERLPEFSGRKVILFSASADPAFLAAARKTEAAGFWYLESSAASLAQVLMGKQPFPEKAPSVQFGNAGSRTLTAREMDVLRQMAAGKSDAQIGEILSISVSTVKHHIQQLRIKTGLENRTQMAVEAIRSGLIGE